MDAPRKPPPQHPPDMHVPHGREPSAEKAGALKAITCAAPPGKPPAGTIKAGCKCTFKEIEYISLPKWPGKIRRRCHALSKRSRERCWRPACRGRDVCRMHGGTAPRSPMENSRWMGSQGNGLSAAARARAAAMPAGPLRERYLAAARDADLGDLRADLALAEARVVELTGRLKSGPTADLWDDLRSTYQRVRAAMQSGDTATAAIAMNDIGRLVDDGASTEEVWDLLTAAIKHRTALVQAEQERAESKALVITRDRALVIFSALLDAVRARVTDADLLAELATTFHTIWTTGETETLREVVDHLPALPPAAAPTE